MSVQTYAAIIEAVQNHVREVHGDDMYARDWVLACGIETATIDESSTTAIQVIKSPRATPYTMTGLLNWAIDMFVPSDDED
jgi:hypothetical protein